MDFLVGAFIVGITIAVPLYACHVFYSALKSSLSTLMPKRSAKPRRGIPDAISSIGFITDNFGSNDRYAFAYGEAVPLHEVNWDLYDEPISHDVNRQEALFEASTRHKAFLLKNRDSLVRACDQSEIIRNFATRGHTVMNDIVDCIDLDTSDEFDCILDNIAYAQNIYA